MTAIVRQSIWLQALKIAGGGGKGPGIRSTYSNVVIPANADWMRSGVNKFIDSHDFYMASEKIQMSLHLTNRDSKRRVCFSFDIPVLTPRR